MDSRGQVSKSLSKKARELHKLGDRAVGSVLDAYRLNDCVFLAPVRSVTVDIDDVDTYLKSPLSKETPNVTFRVMSGADDVGDQQQPSKTLLMRGVLNWIGGKVEFFRVGDPERKVLFSVGFPKDKALEGEPGQRRIPIGKIKHQGVQIFRINQPFPTDHTEEITKTGLEIVKVSEAGEKSSAPYVKVVPKTSLMAKVASFAGMSFEKTGFNCLYMGSQKVASIRPIVGLIQNQIGYTVRFAASAPHPEHQSKTVILAMTTLLLMKLGPVDVEKCCDLSNA